MTDYSGLRVLIVEDEGFVAMMIEDMLEELCCELAGSVGKLANACEMASKAEIDFAILDVNLDGQPVFPVAEILRDRDIPFMFSTGYGVSGIPREFSGFPVLGKPFSLDELQRTIALALPQRS
jgi:CheY-like chemotaxis protein